MQRSFLKRSLKGVLLAALLASTGCAVERTPAEHNWSTYLNNEVRANQTADRVEAPLALWWTKDVSDFRILRPFPKEQLSSPAVHESVLYVASTNDSFYALDLDRGSVLWKYDAEYPLEAPPSVNDGRVCFGSADGILRCLDAKDGRLLWQFQAKSEILSSPIIKDGTVYVSSSDDRVYALSAADGQKIWTYNKTTFETVAPRVYGSSAILDGRLFHFFSDGYLVSVSAATGKELWKKKLVKTFDGSDNIRRTPLIANGYVYMIDEDRAVVAFDPATGELKNSYNVIKAHDFLVPDKRTLILAGVDQAVALDTVSGSILWKQELEYKPLHSLFASRDVLFMLYNYAYKPLGFDFLSSEKGRIEAMGLRDGKKLWSQKLRSTISANGSAGQKKAALLTDKGIVEVFGPDE